MIIRKSLPEDAEAISKLESEIFTDPWSKEDITSCILSSLSMCYTALCDENKIICYIVAKGIAPEAEIYRIATRPDMRGRGIAYRLLDFALKSERKNGIDSIFLEVRENNIPARKLYSSYGFKEIGTRKDYYKNPRDNAIIMLYSQRNENE